MLGKTEVLVLGASGMLGSEVLRCFSEKDGFNVVGTVRSSSSVQYLPKTLQPLIEANIDVLNDDTLISLLKNTKPSIVVNCVGLIKQQASTNDPLVSLPINAIFPHKLARLCELSGARLIHISTDCVFSGKKGEYLEDDISDAEDLYGRSKQLGELTDYTNAITLRTSIIGRELNSKYSLLEWFLAQSGTINGFTNAIFSGLPTNELARVIRDVVAPAIERSGLYHVSSEKISKFELLSLIKDEYKKEIEIKPDSSLRIDRSLNSQKFKSDFGYHVDDWKTLISRMHQKDIAWRQNV